MEDYKIRGATIDDTAFLADVIIAAEKSNSDKLSYSTLFGLSESQANSHIRQMLEEEIDGCELSINSFLVVEYNKKLIAGYGGWIENFEDDPPSKMLKANLINFTFKPENIAIVRSRSDKISNMVIEREKGTLQLEYLFVNPEHRGKHLGDVLIESLIKKALLINPELPKVQIQLFANNIQAQRLYERNGFQISQTFSSGSQETLDYLPDNTKFLMEKTLQ